MAAVLGGCCEAATMAGTAEARTLWLCRPGLAHDPCTVNPSATAIGPSGRKTVKPASDAVRSPFDCFYVYPTVVRGPEQNAPLKVEPVIRRTAIEQASRFSQVCQIWAPVYRQLTTGALVHNVLPTSPGNRLAYSTLLTAYRSFLADHDHGRPIVFIGHSQGAAMLIRLLQSQVDGDPAVRAHVISALLLGGNVQVPTGRPVGATFQHLPLCSSPTQFGCVIAYSSFDQTPPANTVFGVAGRGVSLLSGQTTGGGEQVACVNPARIGGARAPLEPYFASPDAASTRATWVTYPQLYTAGCQSSGNTTWLQVDHAHRPGDTRPIVGDALGPSFGLHLFDLNIALGNLVADVRREETAYLGAQGGGG